MPSNEDLKKSILEIDEKAELEGKNNGEMVAILKELRTDRDTPDAGAKDAAAVKKETQAKKKASKKKKPPFTVAKGKAITTKRGILGEGEEIKAKDLAGGKESIDAFVDSDHIDKN